MIAPTRFELIPDGARPSVLPLHYGAIGIVISANACNYITVLALRSDVANIE
jgi:hypothetical protein